MDLIKYFSILIITYLGLAVGVFISKFTIEEIEKGKKYFLWLKTIVFSCIFYIFMIYLKQNLLIAIPLTLIAAFFTHIINKRIKFVNINILFYGFFAVLIFEMFSSEYLQVLSILIFTFGLTVASLSSLKETFFTKLKKILRENLLYLVLGAILVLFFRI